MLSLRKLRLSLKQGLETLCSFKLPLMVGNSRIIGGSGTMISAARSAKAKEREIRWVWDGFGSKSIVESKMCSRLNCRAMPPEWRNGGPIAVTVVVSFFFFLPLLIFLQLCYVRLMIFNGLGMLLLCLFPPWPNTHRTPWRYGFWQ